MAMKLNIKFGIDFELKRVKNTLAKLDWYSKSNYFEFFNNQQTIF